MDIPSEAQQVAVDHALMAGNNLSERKLFDVLLWCTHGHQGIQTPAREICENTQHT
jgi:hypothetical protein